MRAVLVFVVAGLLAAPAHAETLRTSRLAMGTVVGITVVDDAGRAGPAMEAAWAAIEAGEAALSEWRPDSVTSRLAGGADVSPTQREEALFRWVDTLRDTSGGVFDVLWRSRGASFAWGPHGLRVEGGPAKIDLGGVLKGWLADRAAEALRAAGLEHFLVDAAGDIVAAGNAEGGRGWMVDVAGPDGRLATVRLRDAALSTSGNAGQPGHIHDGVTGAPIAGGRVVSVVAPTGMIADALATAIYAGAGVELATAHGAVALSVAEDGKRRWSRGGRRVFR